MTHFTLHLIFLLCWQKSPLGENDAAGWNNPNWTFIIMMTMATKIPQLSLTWWWCQVLHYYYHGWLVYGLWQWWQPLPQHPLTSVTLSSLNRGGGSSRCVHSCQHFPPLPWHDVDSAVPRHLQVALVSLFCNRGWNASLIARPGDREIQMRLC